MEKGEGLSPSPEISTKHLTNLNSTNNQDGHFYTQIHGQPTVAFMPLLPGGGGNGMVDAFRVHPTHKKGIRERRWCWLGWSGYPLKHLLWHMFGWIATDRRHISTLLKQQSPGEYRAMEMYRLKSCSLRLRPTHLGQSELK